MVSPRCVPQTTNQPAGDAATRCCCAGWSTPTTPPVRGRHATVTMTESSGARSRSRRANPITNAAESRTVSFPHNSMRSVVTDGIARLTRRAVPAATTTLTGTGSSPSASSAGCRKPSMYRPDLTSVKRNRPSESELTVRAGAAALSCRTSCTSAPLSTRAVRLSKTVPLTDAGGCPAVRDCASSTGAKQTAAQMIRRIGLRRRG